MNLRRIIILALALVMILAPLLDERSASAAQPAPVPFERTWNRTDQPVAAELVQRTWMWGPEAFTGPMLEFTSDAPATGRQVQYFDKSRMELAPDPAVNQYSIWHVTNGLLARELVTGQLQVGDNDFEPRSPAEVNVAGDWDDPSGPTYATFGTLLTTPAIEPGSELINRVDRTGNVVADPELASRGIQATVHVPETGHTVAGPFWDFMNATGLVMEDGPARTGPLFPNPFYATGYPITEAYWANVKVAGVYTDVLIQVFERRVLTYTPENSPGWQVEAGNVGRHYFEWRYGISPPEDAPGTSRGVAPLGPAPLPQHRADGDAAVSFTIANQSPYPLLIKFDGGTTATVEVEPCPECQMTGPPSTCNTDTPRQSVTLPAGSYAVTVTRPGDPVQPLAGVWTLLPGSDYGACFFTFR